MSRSKFARQLGAGGAPRIQPPRGPITIAEREPARFREAFAAAAASGVDVFLADPGWSDEQRAAAARIITTATQPRRAGAAPGDGWLMIPSGGTGGGLKFARHDELTLAAAVRGFCEHFGLSRVNAVGVLPLYHVSGLMAWMRCALSGGEYVPWEWKELERGALPERRSGDWVVSLVPTQLQRLLASPAACEWLRGFRVIFVGGGPAWASLLEQAAAAQLPLSLSYGMTETAAMIAALRPEEFFAGRRDCGTALPHGRVEISADGVVGVGGESLFRGYFPAWRAERDFQTEDLGALSADGRLTILGRRDAMIITGGRKVNPADVEAALRASGEFADIAVIGVPDTEWGEAVVACFPAAQRPPDLARAIERLAAHQRPKRFVSIADWPRNAQGKVNRAALLARVRATPHSQFLM